MSEFYRETVIRKPKKQYTCELCGGPITDKHVYCAGKNSDGFQAWRSHIKCHQQMTSECNVCEYSDDCQLSLNDCYFEKFQSKESNQ